MQEKFKLPDQINFILFGDSLDQINRGGSIALALGYNDNANALKLGAGTYVEYVTGKDQKGNFKAKRFRFDETWRKLMTRPTESDLNGISQYAFLKNAPECEGSPNGNYVGSGSSRKQLGVVYREYNPAKDAATALQANTSRILTQARAIELDDETTEEIANILGDYGTQEMSPEQLKTSFKNTVVEFAGKRPSEFDKLLAAGDRPLRALVRKALNAGELTKKGAIIFWENTMLGSEDDAINILQKDEQMVDNLKGKLKLEEDAKNPPKQAGRPKKNAEV